MQYLIISFAALVGIFFITPFFIDLFNKINITDRPDGKRKLHTSAVPRLGGFLIYLTVITFIFIFYGDINSIKYLLFGITVIFAIGAYDDLLGASWLIKFIYQSVSAFLLLLVLIPLFTSVTLFGVELQLIPSIIVLFIFIVGTINSFNLLDGLDGLVAGISLLISSLLFFISLNQLNIFLLILLSTLIGSLIGFLKYNAFPAKIFLGDSGSFLLGYLVISAALILSADNSQKNIDLTFPIILLAVPIVDTIKVFSERLLTGRHPFQADRNHIHHIVFSKNITHKTTVFIITIYSLLFTADAVYYRYYNELNGMIIFFILLIPLIFASRILTFIINRENLIVYGRAINQFPQVIIKYYKIIVLPLISVAILFLLFYFLYSNNNLSIEFLIPSLVLLGLLLVFTIISYRKNKQLNDIIVFFNILIFFIINLSNKLMYQDITHLPLIGNLNFHLLIVAILLPTIGFYLLFRDRVQQIHEVYLSGLDLSIVLLIILLTLTSQLIPLSNSFIITDTIFRSFLIYLFYKILIQLKPAFKVPVYVLSFIVVVISQTTLLLAK